MRNILLEEAERELRVDEITAEELAHFGPDENRHLLISYWLYCRSNFLHVSDHTFSSLENDLFWKFWDYAKGVIDSKLKALGDAVPEHLRKVYHRI
jgi:hypothetical protein